MYKYKSVIIYENIINSKIKVISNKKTMCLNLNCLFYKSLPFIVKRTC